MYIDVYVNTQVRGFVAWTCSRNKPRPVTSWQCAEHPYKSRLPSNLSRSKQVRKQHCIWFQRASSSLWAEKRCYYYYYRPPCCMNWLCSRHSSYSYHSTVEVLCVIMSSRWIQYRAFTYGLCSLTTWFSDNRLERLDQVSAEQGADPWCLDFFLQHFKLDCDCKVVPEQLWQINCHQRKTQMCMVLQAA